MIAAHGSTVTVTPQQVTVHNDPLLTALRGSGPQIPLDRVTGVTVIPGDPVTCGRVLLVGPDAEIVFSPNQTAEMQQFVAALDVARSGDAPAVEIPGLDFIALHVDHDASWDTVTGIAAARVRDGLVIDNTSWGNPGNPDGGTDTADLVGVLADYIGDDAEILVAHNVYRQVTALLRTVRGSGTSILPELSLGCTLALARRERPGDDDHSLAALCGTFGLPAPDSPTLAAEATARLLVLLNGDTTTRDTVGKVLTASGFDLGRIDHERVWPVLDMVPKAPTRPAPAGSEGGKRKSPRTVPWAKVAVPDTIPDPNPDADPDGLLYGQNVTLSGDFGPFDKGRLWHEIADAGATIGKNVTKKTTILVCGEWGKPTSKQKRAEELIAKGQDISLWSAEQLFITLGLDPDGEEDLQPPF
ncbi:hypothetical protein M0E87_04440 [Corynebacterium sp. CCM 9185]|uniref:BRCT domain-containing protein n=1 Tax=Corynebacterium marambiense TaxID=2765364 RepID=A0ABS0VVL3_9CORY|nr:hypothetical protein [Corynebacterium marambiense]MBI9000821.1 hypothetical protein [Corynebacterium marambiense]MCK7662913.1 hypothetical protein [Corynebacterium marambiense]MCX7542522.1 hypothetical protein [Corynebacterium marambiense]